MLPKQYIEIENQFRQKSDLKIDNYFNEYRHEYEEDYND